MERFYQVLVIGAAGLSVALADVLIKRAVIGRPRVADALMHPLTALALVLYTVQVVLFAYVFVRKWQLGIVALMQMAVYATACIFIARTWFGEQITPRQALGMLLASCGAILMTK
jgi:drug/metabolite transporter (DMT)-like permease